MTMSIDDLQARLRDAHARINREGRFAFTVEQDPASRRACYLVHWFRPTPHAFEDCKAVGAGTPEQCLDALERYVDNYRAAPTTAQLAATLGIDSID